MSDKAEEVCLQERLTYKSFNLTQRVRRKNAIGGKQGLDWGSRSMSGTCAYELIRNRAHAQVLMKSTKDAKRSRALVDVDYMTQ